jgi:hypothetical protein
MISVNNGALPYFGLPQSGTNTNQHQFQASYSPGWDFVPAFARYLFDKQGATLQGNIQNTHAYQMSPVSDPEKLLLLQTAFRLAAGDQSVYSDAFQQVDSASFLL